AAGDRGDRHGAVARASGDRGRQVRGTCGRGIVPQAREPYLIWRGRYVMRYTKHMPLGVAGLLLFAGTSAHTQIASLGKGWLLDTAGSVTSAPGEVITGRNSVKASWTSGDPGIAQVFLATDPNFVRFAPNQTYTMTFSYRIITASDGGFGYGFQSGEGN